MANIDILKLDLQLFGEGGGAGGAASGAPGAAAGGTAEGDTGASAAVAARQAGKNPLADVIYGTQEGDADPLAKEKQQAAEHKAKFQELVKGDYKAEYDEAVQDIVKKRLKGMKGLQDQLQSQQSVIERLYDRYPDAKSVEDIVKALDNDTSYLDDEALERGIPREELARMKQTERQLAAMQRQAAKYEQYREAEQQYNQWQQQADEARKYFPDLDLETELEDQRFIDLLKAGIDVKAAYQALHGDEIFPRYAQYAAQQAENKLAASVAANGRRPSENGLRSSSASIVKSNVSQLTKADRAEINRRVARGERITFGSR